MVERCKACGADMFRMRDRKDGTKYFWYTPGCGAIPSNEIDCPYVDKNRKAIE
jgi:hypothetical protein